MKKPQIKREVAISFTIEEMRHISLYTSPDAIEDFKIFGEVMQFSGNENTELYELFVDARYDFGEVTDYIRDYGKNRDD